MKPFTTDAQVSSEAKYKAIFDLVNDAISIRDPDTGAILEVNRKTIELYGYAEDEILTLTVGDLSSGIPPYTREEAFEKVRAAQKQGNLVFEWLYKDKSGRLFWAEVDLKPAIISGNKVVIAVAHDITDRKRMEEFLRQSEERLRTLADAMPQLVWIADPDGTVDYYNERYKDYGALPGRGMEPSSGALCCTRTMCSPPRMPGAAPWRPEKSTRSSIGPSWPTAPISGT